MVDRSKYEASSIDWSRLNRYAARVARETRVLPTPAHTYAVSANERVREASTRRTLFGGIKEEVRYVDRVVERQVEAAGPHWVLGTGYYADEITVSKQRVTEDRDDFVYALSREGKLIRIWVHKAETYVFYGGRSDHDSEVYHRVAPMSEGDVCLFDFSSEVLNGRPAGSYERGEYWRNDISGRRLLRHAKGVGLNLALKDLLEGRQPKRP